MTIFQIWAEGYSATCENAGATLMAVIQAETFSDALREWEKTSGKAKYINLNDPSYWGRRLFDNERDARKLSG